MECKFDVPETITLSFGNARSGFEPFNRDFPAGTLPAHILQQALMLGLSTKYRNFTASALNNCRIAAAGPRRNDESEDAYAKRVERTATTTEALLAEVNRLLDAGAEQLAAGNWGAERGASGIVSPEEKAAEWLVSERPAFVTGKVPGGDAKKKPERIAAVLAWLDTDKLTRVQALMTEDAERKRREAEELGGL